MTTQSTNTTGYTYEQASRELNVSVSTIKKAIAIGVLIPIKHPKVTAKYISVEQVEKYKGKPLLGGVRSMERGQRITKDAMQSVTEFSAKIVEQQADEIVDAVIQNLIDALTKKKSVRI